MSSPSFLPFVSCSYLTLDILYPIIGICQVLVTAASMHFGIQWSMPASALQLTDPSVEVVLAYASTGLGHLRVTNALFEAAPKGVFPHLLKTRDQTASTLHRLTSMNPLSRSLLEWSQNGLPEAVFTKGYRTFLRSNHRGIQAELATLIEQEFNIVKTVLIVATHFGLAHQIAGAKAALSKQLGVKIILAVVVTDDSPQRIWYVEDADILFVPSYETKSSLEAYGKRKGLKKLKMHVVPYPLSPRLSVSLSPKNMQKRKLQCDPAEKSRIEVCVPISGAAVNLDYIENLMSAMYRKNPRFFFYVVARQNMYTKGFLQKLSRRPYVSLITSIHDREIVKYYNDLLSSTVISFEITKPSEQSFKVLLPVTSVGGGILLLSEPVGRQEYDNLDFLKRYGYLNSRAFSTSADASVSAEMIVRMHTEGVFLRAYRTEKSKASHNISSRGAEQFWTELSHLLTAGK